MNKSKKKHVHILKQKPYTLKQENDIVLGKIINWSFILSIPIMGILGAVLDDIKISLLIWGILCLLFAFYNVLGLIFKWDHARVCTKFFLCKKYKYDIRNDWNKEDTKDIISLIVVCTFFGVVLLIGLIFH